MGIKTKKTLSVVLCFLLLFSSITVTGSAGTSGNISDNLQNFWQKVVDFFQHLFIKLRSFFGFNNGGGETEATKESTAQTPPETTLPQEEPLKQPRIIKSEVIAELKTGEKNPRNSEGDFAVLENGDILFAYSKYHSGMGNDHDPCDIAGMLSTDGGNTFVPLEQLLVSARQHDTENVMSVSLEVLSDGTVCLFYLVKNSDGSLESSYVMRKNQPGTLTFGEPIEVIPNISGDYYVVNNCRTQLLPDGRIMVAASRHPIIDSNGVKKMDYVGDAVVYISNADVTGFTKCSDFIVLDAPKSKTGLQEPGIQQLPNGSYRLYARTDLGYQYESYSQNGVNWTAPAPSVFESPASPMLIEKNPYTGIYYAIWNPYKNAGRTPLVLAQSKDGIHFSDFTVLEGDSSLGFCYPAICFLSETQMLISYCFGTVNTTKQLSETRIIKVTVE